MSDQTSLDDIKEFAKGLSPWAHLATVGADGEPDVSPVHPCWEGDICWVMVGKQAVKSRNVTEHPAVAMHWQVTAVGDGVEVWGTAALHDDLATKQRLWTGVFDYDLNAFAPGGPDASPDTAFMAVTPTRAIILKQYGMGGVDRWSASA